MKILAKAVDKVKSAVRPKLVDSTSDVISLFKKEKIMSVTIEPTCYTTLSGVHILTVVYVGDGDIEKPVVRHEVLSTHEEESTDEFLVKEFKKLYPSIRERAEKLRSELGISVTIPGHFVKALAISPSH